MNIIDDIFDNADALNESDYDDWSVFIDAGTMMNYIDIFDDDGQQGSTNYEQISYDPNLRTPSYIVFNKYLKLLKINISGNQSSKTSFLLNQIVILLVSPSVSLTFPDSMLHLSIFIHLER